MAPVFRKKPSANKKLEHRDESDLEHDALELFRPKNRHALSNAGRIASKKITEYHKWLPGDMY